MAPIQCQDKLLWFGIKKAGSYKLNFKEVLSDSWKRLLAIENTWEIDFVFVKNLTNVIPTREVLFNKMGDLLWRVELKRRQFFMSSRSVMEWKFWFLLVNEVVDWNSCECLILKNWWTFRSIQHGHVLKTCTGDSSLFSLSVFLQCSTHWKLFCD